MRVIDHPSPNFNTRPCRPYLLLAHGTAGSSVEGDLAWLCDEARKEKGGFYDVSLSYHYLIGRSGVIYRLVNEDDRAWHAGRSHWRGRRDVNDFSIGVGLTNRGPGSGEKYTPEQYASLGWLSADIFRRREEMSLDEVAGHYEVSPGRKTDPWDYFSWERFHDETGMWMINPDLVPIPQREAPHVSTPVIPPPLPPIETAEVEQEAALSQLRRERGNSGIDWASIAERMGTHVLDRVLDAYLPR